MPGHGQGRVHRFRDHVVAGVNWRPTKFVDEVPSSRVCGLCRMIPKRMVLLPCSHALCQSCHAASLEGGVGQCPLDQVQFDEAECFTYEFPTRIANTLKVYCWNEEHGCGYTGTTDHVLEHYEKECTCHTVECLRCGEGVQHRDLPTHCAAGCTARVSVAITACPSSEPTALTLEDVNADKKNLKAMLGNLIHDQLLPVMQSQLNELTEQVRKQEAGFAEITREIGASERNLKGDMAQIAATISSTVSHQLTSLENPEVEASTSSSLTWRLEKAMMFRNSEHLAARSVSALGHLRQTSAPPHSSGVIAHCEPLYSSIRHLTSVLSARDRRISLTYILTLENCNEMICWQVSRRKFAEIMVWHMRDTYFTVATFKCLDSAAPVLIVEIEFNGMLADSRGSPPFWHMEVCDYATPKCHSLTSRAMPCLGNRRPDSLLHFHLEFRVRIASLIDDGFLKDGKLTFEIALTNSEVDGGVKGTP
ncbi:uncharacterized protein LOC142557987 [Dermacentor variabilis]|uniref:uncharacterized protein LOC142557987 n=1 Tax=Dermacentor variabilis TaxID=34621 RepID=UPI003F5C6008